MYRTHSILALTVAFTALCTHRSEAQTGDFPFRFNLPSVPTIARSAPVCGRPLRIDTTRRRAVEGFGAKLSPAAGSRSSGRGGVTRPESGREEPEEPEEFHANHLALYLGGTAPSHE